MDKTCIWPKGDPQMVKYHDKEWGKPIYTDKKLFEFLVLESAQAGLSWSLILHKRDGYRKAFANFDPVRVAQFDKKDVAKLLNNRGIIRNRLKIEATINNAQRFLEIKKEFGTFSRYMWGFVGNKPINGRRKSYDDIPEYTKEAEIFSKDLKKRGMKFLGPSIVYAHMQAVGMVNDHVKTCFRYRDLLS